MAKAKDEPQFLYVRSNLEGDEVALHEIDPAHPGGSVLVAGRNTEKVGDTAFVRSRLRDRWLVEVKTAADKKPADERAKAREEMMSAESVVAVDDREWFDEDAAADQDHDDRDPDGPPVDTVG